jgi:hypothetical protein
MAAARGGANHAGEKAGPATLISGAISFCLILSFDLDSN